MGAGRWSTPARRGGWPGSVLRVKTLARIRGPAIRPAAAPAMIHGGVTVSPHSCRGTRCCPPGMQAG